jgi:hypothetical protein
MRASFFALLLFGVGLAGCATSGAPSASPPADPTVASLTRWLKLDPAQQARTQELLRELSDRNSAIQAGWNRGERMRPQALLESRAIFERDFLAILTPPQREQIGKAAVILATRGRGVR